jgi:hypothetical protein
LNTDPLLGKGPPEGLCSGIQELLERLGDVPGSGQPLPREGESLAPGNPGQGIRPEPDCGKGGEAPLRELREVPGRAAAGAEHAGKTSDSTHREATPEPADLLEERQRRSLDLPEPLADYALYTLEGGGPVTGDELRGEVAEHTAHRATGKALSRSALCELLDGLLLALVHPWAEELPKDIGLPLAQPDILLARDVRKTCTTRAALGGISRDDPAGRRAHRAE